MKKVHFLITILYFTILTGTLAQGNQNSEGIDFMEFIKEPIKNEYSTYNSKTISDPATEQISFYKYELYSREAKISTASGQEINPKNRFFFSAREIGTYIINISPHDHDKANIYLENGNFYLKNGVFSRAKLSDNIERINNTQECTTNDDLRFLPQHAKNKKLSKTSEIGTVNVYFEVDYYTYQDFHGNIPIIIDWVAEIFAQIKSIYLLHNIDLQISEIKINDIDDGMLNNYSLNQNLLSFGDRIKNDFEGDIAQLLTTKNLGGGRAYINGLCRKYDPVDSSGPYSISSAVSKTIENNNYSWSIYVTSHELGHLLGSPHTHACAWGINGEQALDNCHQTEGGCEVSQSSNYAGTIMSYCNIYGSGINFTNGLGTDPSELIINNIINSTCISTNNQASICTIGSSCDDNDICTAQDSYDESCNCIGILIDINDNGICDNYDPCEENLVINSIPITDTAFISQNQIISTAHIESNSQIIFSAGQEIVLGNDFEIKTGSTLEISISNCGN